MKMMLTLTYHMDSFITELLHLLKNTTFLTWLPSKTFIHMFAKYLLHGEKQELRVSLTLIVIFRYSDI